MVGRGVGFGSVESLFLVCSVKMLIRAESNICLTRMPVQPFPPESVELRHVENLELQFLPTQNHVTQESYLTCPGSSKEQY